MKHDGPNFNHEYRANSRIFPIGKKECDFMVKKHYLGRWPGVTVLRLGLFHKIELVGCCIFAIPPREIYKRYGGTVWELARLWISDILPRNSETFLIGRSIRFIRTHYKDVDGLVSYADPSQQHIGTIYKASNWTPDGRTDDERKSPRCDYWVGNRKFSRRSHVPDGAQWERRPRVSKFRFYYHLNPKSANPVTLNLSEKPNL